MKKGDFSLCALVENYGYKIRIWTRAEDIRAREEMALLLQFLETLPQYSIRM